MLDNLPWQALNTVHARLAISSGRARKYQPDVAPFGGTADNSAESIGQLLTLLEPGEIVYVVDEIPAGVPGLVEGMSLPVLQMIASDVPARQDGAPVRLSAGDAGEMVSLTDLAFPGFFRARTYEMGVYYGVRLDGELIAMAGERMAVPGYREISGVCTHPTHTGKGYAAMLITHLMREHAAAGVQSFLHVSAGNIRAIELYRRLGFVVKKEFPLRAISRDAGK